MIRPKKGSVVWVNVTGSLCRKVKVMDKRTIKGNIEYKVSYMLPNGGSRWVGKQDLIKYA
jgi:hypothetical protein